MDTKKWMNAMTEIDDKYIKEAMDAKAAAGTKQDGQNRWRKNAYRFGRIAQCAAVASCALILTAALAGGVLRWSDGGSGSNSQLDGDSPGSNPKPDGDGAGAGIGRNDELDDGAVTTPTTLSDTQWMGEEKLIFNEASGDSCEFDLALPDGAFFYEMTQEDIAGIWGQEELVWEDLEAASVYDLYGSIIYDGNGVVWTATVYGYEKDVDPNEEPWLFSIECAPDRLPPQCIVNESEDSATCQIWGTDVKALWSDTGDRVWYEVEFIRSHDCGNQTECVGVHVECRGEKAQQEELEVFLNCLVSQSLRENSCLRLSQLNVDIIKATEEETGIAPTLAMEQEAGIPATLAMEQENELIPTSASEVESETEKRTEWSRIVDDFTVRLLQKTFETQDTQENVLLSPLSILEALSMTANGAVGTTRQQMELALGADVELLNQSLLACRETAARQSLTGESQEGTSNGGINETRAGAALHSANGIWVDETSGFTVKESFAQVMETWYDAALSICPFDRTAQSEINQWVSQQTKGRIQDFLGEIPDETKMILINAIAFDGTWESVYEDIQVREGTFTAADGTVQQVSMMHSEESLYLEDPGLATGFLKYYEDRRYAFAALMPREELSVKEYAAMLTGTRLQSILETAENVPVLASMPKFTAAYETDLTQVLKQMGMVDAFDETEADFTAMGQWNGTSLSIGMVLHRTWIGVNEQGTEAGAATAVLMDGAGGWTQEPREVCLDRPFLYLILDCEQGIPVFLGTIQSIPEAR